MSDDEKRRAERYSVNDEFAALSGEGGVTFVSDLSERGVFVHARDQIAIGEIIDLRFTLVLDDPVVIQARGKVVRHAPGGIGVEFTQLAPDMVLRVHDAISRQKAAQRGAEKLAKATVEARAAVTPSRPSEFDDQKTGVFSVLEVDPADIEDDEDDEPG